MIASAPPRPRDHTSAGQQTSFGRALTLSLRNIDRQGLIIVSAVGQITMTDLPADGTNPLAAILGPTWSTHRLLLDLSGIDYIDSSAVGWLITTQRVMHAAGGTLAVFGLQPAVRNMLELLRVGRAVTLAADEESARNALLGGAK